MCNVLGNLVWRRRGLKEELTAEEERWILNSFGNRWWVSIRDDGGFTNEVLCAGYGSKRYDVT
jgi:hypothetical protein